MVRFQGRFIGIMNHASKACVDEYAVMEMRPLLLRIRMEKDSILDARDHRTFVSHIDRDHNSNMNRLAIVVAH